MAASLLTHECPLFLYSLPKQIVGSVVNNMAGVSAYHLNPANFCVINFLGAG
ncbi:hypothetical protein J536_1452 [Acinetobacter sp. 809848]|nr:hypothetical protein J536_1452 [Acinetobacter sp. 809848]